MTVREARVSFAARGNRARRGICLKHNGYREQWNDSAENRVINGCGYFNATKAKSNLLLFTLVEDTTPSEESASVIFCVEISTLCLA